MSEYVCERHFDEAYLRRFVHEYLDEPGEDDNEDCTFCDAEPRPGAPLYLVVEVVENALNRHFDQADDAGVPRADGEYVFSTYDTSEALADLGTDTAMDWDVYEKVLASIEDDAWVAHGSPVRSRAKRLRDGWQQFRMHVQHTSRFLLQPDDPADEHGWDPDPDYRPSEMMRAITGVITNEIGLLTTIPAGTPVYRSRTFDEQPPKKPHELVSPPMALAKQGRMNAAGVSVLYGALDADTAASEVYDGRRYAVVATLRPLRNLDVVDLTKVPTYSYFDPRVQMKDLENAEFLHGFVADIRRAIIRDDRVHYEYAPTQYVTEYLRWQVAHGHVELDGIVYPSSRAGGAPNVVIFATPDMCLSDDEFDADKNRPYGASQLLRLEPTVEIRVYGTPPSRPLRREPISGFPWS